MCMALKDEMHAGFSRAANCWGHVRSGVLNVTCAASEERDGYDIRAADVTVLRGCETHEQD
jgi:hypothetical protein